MASIDKRKGSWRVQHDPDLLLGQKLALRLALDLPDVSVGQSARPCFLSRRVSLPAWALSIKLGFSRQQM
jgi:hypothetical protein